MVWSRFAGASALSIAITASVAIAVPQRESQDATTSEVHFPQEPANGFLRVPVDIEGVRHRLVVDLGANAVILNALPDEPPRTARNIAFRSAYSHLHVESPLSGVVHESEIMASVPGVIEKPLVVTHLDFGDMVARAGIDLDGVLGAPFFTGLGFGYDCRKHTLFFGLTSPRYYANAYRISTVNGRKCVAGISINGENLTPAMATAMIGGIYVNEEMFDRLVIDGSITAARKGKAVSAAGIRDSFSGRLRNACVWGVNLEDVPVTRSQIDAVGLAVIRKFDFYYDDSSSLFYVNATASTKEPFRYDWSGLTLGCNGDAAEVLAVSVGSLAHMAGVATGDRVIGLNGAPVDCADIDRLKGVLREPHRVSVELLIQRGADSFVVHLDSKIK